MQSTTQISDTDEYEQIFHKYLEICNRAIESNKSKSPFSEIWGSRFKALEEEALLDAVVFDDRPKIGYKLRLTPEMKIEIAEKKPVVKDDTWPFKYQYLKRVVENPQEYIDNPAKLEWGWLETVFKKSHPAG